MDRDLWWVAAIVILLALLLIIVFKLKKAKSINEIQLVQKELKGYIIQYICTAEALRQPLREFWYLVKNNPKELQENHKAEELLQELVEIDLILRAKINFSRFICDEKLIVAIEEFLLPNPVRDISCQDLERFLNSALDKSKSIFEIMQEK